MSNEIYVMEQTINKLSNELTILADYIKNFNAYYHAGKATISLTDAKLKYDSIASDYVKLEAAYKATLAQLTQATQPNYNYGQSLLGNTPLVGGVSISSRGGVLNAPVTESYNTTTKGMTSLKDVNHAPQQTQAPAENLNLNNLGVPPMHNFAPLKTEPPKPKFFFLETGLKVIKKEGTNEYLINGKSSLDDPISITEEHDKNFNINPLFTIDNNDGVMVISAMKKVYLNNKNGIFDRYLDTGFSKLGFKEVTSSDSAEFILYQNVKDIIVEYLEILFGERGNSTCITDIKHILNSSELSVTALNIFSNVFKEIKLTESLNTKALERVPRLLELDVAGSHIFFHSSNIDFENLLQIETSAFENRLILNNESYLTLYNVIKEKCRPHGILELINGIKYRYFVGTDKIVLKRMNDLA